jgi:integrase
MTVAEYAEKWRANQVQHRQGTAERVETIFRLHLYPVLGRRPLATVERVDVQNLVTAWSARAAPRTIRQRTAFVSAMFASAELDGLIDVTPCRKIKTPQVEPELVRPLTREQVRALADAVPGHLRLVVLAGAGLGVRVSEALGITADRVRYDRGEVLVDRQQEPRPPYGVAPLKNSRRAPFRAIPAPAVLLEEFAGLNPPGAAGRLFVRPDGRPVTARHVRDQVSRAVVAVGLPEGTRYHDLRHHYASTLIDRGESVPVVARLLGDTPTEVLRTYAHLFEESSARVREIVDEAFTDRQ